MGTTLTKRRRWLWGLLAVLVTLGVGLAAMINVANVPPPHAPELSGVVVTPPARSGPVSPHLVPKKGATGTVHPTTGKIASGPVWPEAVNRVLYATRRKWLADPDAMAARVAKLKPTLEEAREALLTPGCMPPFKLGGIDLVQSMVRHLTDQGRRIALDAVLAAERGEAAAAAAALVAINERYLELERCVPQLTEAMFLAAAIEKTHAQFRWVLSADPSEQTVATFVHHSAKLESRGSPLPDAFRLEYANMKIGWVGDIGPWPWYDSEESEALWLMSARRAVWLAEAGPRDALFAIELPEDKWANALKATPSFYGLFRFNHHGRNAMQPQAAGRYATYWYTQRCWIAARRATWSRTLASRDVALPSVPEPRDPWRDVAFGKADRAGKQCDPPVAFRGVMDERKLAPLPERRAR